jgi:copper homeostasis protein
MVIGKAIKVEVCAFGLESCMVAAEAGANRIELCGGLYEGGTTPSAGLISQVKNKVNLELFVMIRPRGGDFLYSSAEIEVMKADIEMAKKLGADGIVLGILKENGEVNIKMTKELVDLAWPTKTTFHRAIDVTPNAYEAMEMIIETGCVRILTSGQQNKVTDGLQLIENLVQKAQNRIEIMPGAGVNADNAELLLNAGVSALHLTGKSVRDSAMKYRKNDVSMSEIEGISEFDLVYADRRKIRKVVEIVKSFKK